jgi:hypothetical protein
MFVDVLSTVGSVLLGCLMTWYVSRFYYKKAGDDLVKEAVRLRHLSTIMLNVMEDAGFVKLNRDKSGDVVGRVVPLSATFESGTQMFGELQVTKAQPTIVQPSPRSSSDGQS